MSLPLEQQVVSLPLAQRLKELGVKQESLFTWMKPYRDAEWKLYYKWKNVSDVVVSAFTVAELGEMLPEELRDEEDDSLHHLRSYPIGAHWACAYVFHNGDDGTWSTTYVEKARTEADARAKMLIYLLENNVITL